MINFIKKNSYNFLFLFFSLFLVYFPTVVHAGTDNVMFSQYCASNTNNGTTHICGGVTTWFSRYDYTAASTNANEVVVWGHRHSNSADIYADVCIIPYGTCWSHTFSAAEIGANMPLGSNPQTPLAGVPALASLSWYGGSFQILTELTVQDAEAWITGQAYATYPDPPVPTPLTPPTVPMNFHVHANCSAENIPGANILLSQPYGGGTSAYTDQNGDASIGVTSNTNVSWFASQSNYSSNSGTNNSGAGGTTVDVTLNRLCGSPPPPPPVCSDVNASNYGGALPCTYPAPPVGCVGDCAEYESQSVPTTVGLGDSFLTTVTMKNVGTTVWDSNYRLGAQNPQDNTNWLAAARVFLSSPVSPGEQVTFSFYSKTPPAIGSYNFQWRMVNEFVRWFGDYTPNVVISVTNPTLTSTALLTDMSDNSVTSVVSNASTQYKIKVRGTDTAGGSRLRYLDWIINYQGANSDGTSAKARGAGKWAPDTTYTSAPYNASPYKGARTCTYNGAVSATGGSAVIWQSWGSTYIYSLDACDVVDSGSTRTVSYTVKFDTTFTNPTINNPFAGQGNDISTSGQDQPTSTFITGTWVNTDLNFGIGGAPTVTYTCGGSHTCAVDYNTTVPVTWSATNATSCSRDGGASIAVSGSANLGPITTRLNTTMTCVGPGGSGSDSLTANINPPTVSYGCGGASPGGASCSATFGNTVPRYWTTSGASSCTLDAVAKTPNITSSDTYTVNSSVSSNLICTSDAVNAVTTSQTVSISLTGGSTVPLTVTATPSPKGYVSSTLGGIDCGLLNGSNRVTCSGSMNIGSTTSLTAVPASSYWQFNGWSVSNSIGGPDTGECTGVGLCTLTISAAKWIIANFIPRPFTIIEF